MDYAEIFKTAAMNTLLGMGTVFLVLIFISFVIGLFKYLAPKASEKAVSAILNKSVEAEEVRPEEAEPAFPDDNGELIAVLTAAIRASMEIDNINPAEYVVRSIRRR